MYDNEIARETTRVQARFIIRLRKRTLTRPSVRAYMLTGLVIVRAILGG
jgi:hypothetical protein